MSKINKKSGSTSPLKTKRGPAFEVFGSMHTEIVVYEDNDLGRRLARFLHENLHVDTAICWDPDMGGNWDDAFVNVRLFVVDLSLYGTNRGLVIIRNLAAARKAGLGNYRITALSGHQNLKQRALGEGADEFIDKDVFRITFPKLAEEYNKQLHAQEPPESTTTRLEGIVLSFQGDTGVVAMTINDKQVEREFERQRLESIGAVPGSRIEYIAVSRAAEVRASIRLKKSADEPDDSWKQEYKAIIQECATDE
jgi:CheY-like chemotaxis protein